ncbi:MAG: MBL fold metallo-hydrolase [Planctomycetota bacterium]
MPLKVIGEATGPFAENTYVAIDEATGQAAVVDPGQGALDIWRRAEADGAVLERVLLTHAHLDHIWGLRELVEAVEVPVHLHLEDRFWIENYVVSAAQWGFEVEPTVMPTDWWEHGDHVTVGETDFEVRHTPGHAPGHVALCFDGGAFSGDLVMGFGIGRTDFPRCDPAALKRSIREQIYTLPDETVLYPGHYSPARVVDEKTQNQFVRTE